MKPVEFPEMTTVWAKDQAPYRPLPAYTDERQTISLWSLTWSERFRILLTGRLWVTILNFGQPLQPQLPRATSPFVAAR